MMLGRAVSFVWNSSKSLTIVNFLLTLLQGLLPLVPLYLMKLLIDSIEDVISGGDTGSFGHIGLLIGIMGGVALLMAAVKALAVIVEETQSRVVTDYMQDILHKKSIGVDLAYYEDSRFYDTLHRAQREAPFRPTSIVNGLIKTIQSSVSLLGNGRSAHVFSLDSCRYPSCSRSARGVREAEVLENIMEVAKEKN